MTLPHRIESMQAHDVDFIWSSWLKSYRSSPHTRKWSEAAYLDYQRPRIERLLGRSQVLVARPLDWAQGILGYLVYEPNLIHYVYVKSTYRHQGVARSLLATSGVQLSECSYSHRVPPFALYLDSAGSHYQKHIGNT